MGCVYVCMCVRVCVCVCVCACVCVYACCMSERESVCVYTDTFNHGGCALTMALLLYVYMYETHALMYVCALTMALLWVAEASCTFCVPTIWLTYVR